MRELGKDLQEIIREFGEKPAAQRLDNKTFDMDGYKTAIQRAVRDLTARTLKPKKPKREDDVGETLIDTLLDESKDNSFLNQIAKFFKDDPCSQTAFDIWHHNRCREILKILQSFYDNQDGSAVRYGKAQKIVNMTLKGCYCLQGAREREAYFTYCHMALDSFTLEWYKRTLKNGNIKEIKVDTVWSNLDEQEYIAIQYGRKDSSIRKLKMGIKSFDVLTPLQKEFLIWPIEIMIDTVKAVNKCFGGMVDRDYANAYFKQYGLTNDLTMANIILGKEDLDKSDTEYIDWLKHIPGNQPGKKKAATFILEKNGIT